MNQNIYQEIKSIWQQNFINEKSHFDYSSLKKRYTDAHSIFTLVNNFSPELSEESVFCDENNKQYKGLKQYELQFDECLKPIYLFDNHNVALFSFFELQKSTGNTFDVVHIDAHRDDAIFPNAVCKPLSYANIEKEMKKCRVSDYLDYAVRAGLIGNIFSVTQSFEFESFVVPEKPFLLNLDLDIFGEEGSCVDLDIKVRTIAKAWGKADAVVLATSPGFIDQRGVFEVIKFL